MESSGERTSYHSYTIHIPYINLEKKLSPDIAITPIFQKAMRRKGYEYVPSYTRYKIASDKKIQILITLGYNKTENRSYILLLSDTDEITDEQFKAAQKDILEIVAELTETDTPFGISNSEYETASEEEEANGEAKSKPKRNKTNYKDASEHTVFIAIKDNKELAEKIMDDGEIPRTIEIITEPDDIEGLITRMKRKFQTKTGKPGPSAGLCRDIPIDYVLGKLDKVNILIAYLFKPVGEEKHELAGLAFVDYPKSAKKPFYLHLICAHEAYKGVADYMMQMIKSMAGDTPIVLYSVEGLPKYYRKRHGFKTIKMPTYKKSLKGLTAMKWSRAAAAGAGSSAKTRKNKNKN